MVAALSCPILSLSVHRSDEYPHSWHNEEVSIIIHGAMGRCPYEIVFGQLPRSTVFPGVSPGIILEEEVEGLAVERDESGSDSHSPVGGSQTNSCRGKEPGRVGDEVEIDQ